jgi:hypothetical protein
MGVNPFDFNQILHFLQIRVVGCGGEDFGHVHLHEHK